MKTKIAAYMDKMHPGELVLSNRDETIDRLYVAYMRSKAYQAHLFWSWGPYITAQDLESEFNPHEVMELLSYEGYEGYEGYEEN